MPGRGMGRKVPTDWEHVERFPLSAAPIRLEPPPPDTVLRHRLPFRYDQGQTPRCVDFGSATTMSAIEWMSEHQEVPFKTGYLYRWAVRHDEFPGDPGGTSVRAGMDYIRTLGMIPARLADRPRRKITENRWAQSMGEVLAVLRRQPVPIGVNWHAGMMDPDPAGYIHATGSVVGGHFTTLFGLNMPEEYVDIGQTWGPRWWPEAETEPESWNAKLSLVDLERILFSEDGEAVAITDRLELVG